MPLFLALCSMSLNWSPSGTLHSCIMVKSAAVACRYTHPVAKQLGLRLSKHHNPAALCDPSAAAHDATMSSSSHSALSMSMILRQAKGPSLGCLAPLLVLLGQVAGLQALYRFALFGSSPSSTLVMHCCIIHFSATSNACDWCSASHPSWRTTSSTKHNLRGGSLILSIGMASQRLRWKGPRSA